MDEARGKADKIANCPLKDLPLSKKLYRALDRMGLKTLYDAFLEDEDVIRSKCSSDAFRQFELLVDLFEENPEEFIARIDEMGRPRETVDSIYRAAGEDPVSGSLMRDTPLGNRRSTERKLRSSETDAYANDEFRRVADTVTKAYFYTENGKQLKGFQNRANESLALLIDRFGSDRCFIFQVFDEFSCDLEDLRSSFMKMYRDYGTDTRLATAFAWRYLPDAFAVFTADLARDVYSETNLWGNFFDKLRIRNQNAQNEYKLAFVDVLKQRGMPRYAQDESQNYYYYTTLLHGGLSQDSWVDLWRTSLLPFARDLDRWEAVVDGRGMRSAILGEGSKYRPKESVCKILGKASPAMVDTLLESAYSIARDVSEGKEAGSDFIVLSGGDIPRRAIDALRAVLSSDDGSSSRSGSESGCISRSRSTDAKSESSRTRKTIVDFPRVDLRLDIEEGKVVAFWPTWQFDKGLAGCRVQFIVNGVAVEESIVHPYLGKTVLDAGEIPIDPDERYNLEIRLLPPSSDSEDYENLDSMGSMRLEYGRTLPACFEFIEGRDGVFRLRRKDEFVRRRKRVAFVVRQGYFVSPETGMELDACLTGSGSWANESVELFFVEPGAAGSICMTNSDGSVEEVAAISESFHATIDKRMIIGETFDGLDLYGCTEIEGMNAGLPRIVLESADPDTVPQDLKVDCICDGRKVSVGARCLSGDDEVDGPITIELNLAGARIPWHSSKIEISVYSGRERMRKVMRYRFATVPLSEFRLLRFRRDHCDFVATYVFTCMKDVALEDQLGTSIQLKRGDVHSFAVPLRDEYLPMRILSSDGEVETFVRLALAAIVIEISPALIDRVEKRPLCLADALSSFCHECEIKIQALGFRYNRAVVIGLCEGGTSKGMRLPYLAERFTRPADRFIRILRDPREDAFTPPHPLIARDSTRCEDLLVTMGIGYGCGQASGTSNVNRSECGLLWTEEDAPLLPCREGIGFSWIWAQLEGERYVLKTDRPALWSARLDFFVLRAGGERMSRGTSFLGKGKNVASIPERAEQSIRRRMDMLVRIVPASEYGTTADDDPSNDPFAALGLEEDAVSYIDNIAFELRLVK